jgi:hypothetical protein
VWLSSLRIVFFFFISHIIISFASPFVKIISFSNNLINLTGKLVNISSAFLTSILFVSYLFIG